jgi:endoglucanase
MYQTLKKCLPAEIGVSGFEEPISARIAEEMRPLVDEIYTDAMGNLICLKKGSDEAPSAVMLTAHMDEIGFVVNYIEESGFLRVAPIGGIDYTAAAYAEVVFENGVRGVLAPESDRKAGEAPTAEKCYVDIGVSSRREAEKKVKIGDTLALLPHVTRLAGGRICGRPLDNRVGCAVLIEVARRLEKRPFDVYFVFSVQEEVGCRGARPAAFGIAPELSLVVDVTGTGDTVGAKPMAVKLGEGVAVKVKDKSVICHREVVSGLLDLAKAKNIPAQTEILTYGDTDTSAVQMTGLGCRAGALSVPCRYIHSGNEMLDLRDVKAAVSLMVAYLEEVTL